MCLNKCAIQIKIFNFKQQWEREREKEKCEGKTFHDKVFSLVLFRSPTQARKTKERVKE